MTGILHSLVVTDRDYQRVLQGKEIRHEGGMQV